MCFSVILQLIHSDVDVAKKILSDIFVTFLLKRKKITVRITFLQYA